MFAALASQFKGHSFRANLMRDGAVSIAIKALSIGLSVLTVIVLARALGPEQYGTYSYVLGIVSLLAIPAMFGLPTLIVRETAKAEVNREWGKIRGLWFWSNNVVASSSLVIAVIAGVFLFLNRDSFSSTQLLTFAWGIAFIPFSALAALRGASLRGLRKVIQGQLPEQILKPVLFVIVVAVVSMTGSTQLTASSAMMMNAISAGVAFAFGAWLLIRSKPKQLRAVEKQYCKREWTVSAIPFALLAGLAVVVTQTDIIMLGLLGSATDVGVYKIAMQGAELAALGIVTANMIAMPYMSRFSSSDDKFGLVKITHKSARVSFLIAIGVLIIFIGFGDELILFALGEDYINAYSPLLLLTLGQVIHAGFGPGGTVLNMCGYEKATLITLILSAALNVMLNSLLIPPWGLNGAATATLAAVLFRKITIWIMVYRTLGFDSSAVGFSFNKK